MQDFIIPLSTIIIGWASYYIMNKFYPSYFSEKGKNLATKQDIEEITHKIERVKSDISLLTHKKISLASEKQKSIFNVHSAFFILSSTIRNHNFSFNYQDECIDVCQKIEKKIQKQYHELGMAVANTRIFYDENDPLMIGINNLQDVFLEKLNEFLKAARAIKRTAQSNSHDSYDKITKYRDEWYKKRNTAVRDEIRAAYSDFSMIVRETLKSLESE